MFGKKKFKFPLKKELKELLTSGRHFEIFTHNHGRILQKVDFKNQVVTNGYNTGHYKIALTDKIYAGSEVACVIPNHPESDKQVMFIHDYWTLESFHKELNARLKDSQYISDGVGTAQLAVCYGNHAYLCEGITGTAYVVWTSHISLRNRSSNVAATLTQNTPIIINKDGRQVYKGIYILPLVAQDEAQLSRIPFERGSPNILYSTKTNIFVCETRVLKTQKSKIKTMTAEQAKLFLTTQDTNLESSVSKEINPWESSINFEEDICIETFHSKSSNSFNYGSDPDGGTPRNEEDIFLQELPTDPRRLQQTPPVLHSDPDPFDEEDEKDSKFVPIKLVEKEKEEQEEII